MDSININRKMHLEREVNHVHMLMDHEDLSGREIERMLHVLNYLSIQIQDLDNAEIYTC